MAMLFGVGGLSVVSGLATQQWSGAVTGALCLGMGVFILRGERKGVVRHMAVQANGQVQLDIGKEHLTVYCGDITKIAISPRRGRSFLELRDGSGSRLALPMDGFDDVVEAIQTRHRGLEVKKV